MMNRWHATKPSPCRAHLLESQRWQLASCAEPPGANYITLSDRCLVWKYIDKELVHVSFWCPNLGFWMNHPRRYLRLQRSDRSVICVICVNSRPSNVGRRDGLICKSWKKNVENWALNRFHRFVFSRSSTAFPTDFSMLRDAHPPEAEELAGIDKVPQKSELDIIYTLWKKLTYPTLGKGKPSSKLAFQGIC